MNDDDSSDLSSAGTLTPREAAFQRRLQRVIEMELRYRRMENLDRLLEAYSDPGMRAIYEGEFYGWIEHHPEDPTGEVFVERKLNPRGRRREANSMFHTWDFDTGYGIPVVPSPVLYARRANGEVWREWFGNDDDPFGRRPRSAGVEGRYSDPDEYRRDFVDLDGGQVYFQNFAMDTTDSRSDDGTLWRPTVGRNDSALFRQRHRRQPSNQFLYETGHDLDDVWYDRGERVRNGQVPVGNWRESGAGPRHSAWNDDLQGAAGGNFPSLRAPLQPALYLKPMVLA